MHPCHSSPTRMCCFSRPFFLFSSSFSFSPSAFNVHRTACIHARDPQFLWPYNSICIVHQSPITAYPNVGLLIGIIDSFNHVRKEGWIITYLVVCEQIPIKFFGAKRSRVIHRKNIRGARPFNTARNNQKEQFY